MRRALQFVVVVALAGGLLAGTVLALAPQANRVVGATSSVPEALDLDALDAYAVRSQVFAADGSLLATLHGPENREPVPLDRVPQPVVDAVLAVEDADFYQHPGVNLRAMTRALFENVSAGEVEQGGSTITQQLVKNALLSNDRDLDRKTTEIAYALRLEDQLTKDQILETYLNTVYFGAGSYGVQAAAETYWGKDVGELGWAEAALLAGVIRNPVAYDPTLHPDAAEARRQVALERIVLEGYLTPEEAATYDDAPLPVARCAENDGTRPVSCGDATLPPPDDYFVEAVKQQLLDDPRLGATREDRINAVFSGGLRIETTLDPAAQFAAELAQAQGVPPNDLGVTSAIVSLDSTTGAVRALVGGPGFDGFQYDIATHEPGRQTGSTFKTLVLLTALEQGNLPFDSISGGGSFDNPKGEPDPYVVSGRGGTLESVTTASSNGAFVRLGQVVGLEHVATLAGRLGITSALDPSVMSMPLGTFETTPIEMAGAYRAIANGGMYEPWYMIERVEDRDGNVLIGHEAAPTRVFSADTACRATEILEANVQSGTGTRARLPEQVAAGKTGTTEEHYDAWFVGFTPYLTTAVWMGNPERQVEMENLGGIANFGGTYPAMMWQKYNAAVHDQLEPRPFPTCPPPDRYRRNVRGLGDNELNGGRDEDGDRSRAGSTRPRSGGTTTTTRRAAADGGDEGGTSPTTSGAPTPTSPPSTTNPRPGNRGVN